MGGTTIVEMLQDILIPIEKAINSNTEFKIAAGSCSLVFGVKSSDEKEALLVRIHLGKVELSIESPSATSFVLVAKSSQWNKFFAPVLEPPFQSYWGMLRVLGSQEGCEVLGDVHQFAVYARVWRLFLDMARMVKNNKLHSDDDVIDNEDTEEDVVIGRYTRIETPSWGRSKIYYEMSGNGDQDILFLHTAGADSRQYHSLMENKSLCQRLRMIAFDLPSHGRSSPGSKQELEGHVTTEEDYVSAIQQVIQKAGLRRPIVCGPSMAGQICLAVAIRATELEIAGVIPCEACDYLPLPLSPIYDLSGGLDQSVLNAERVSGMIAPMSPRQYQRDIWWGYSSQGAKVFSGDLEFYFHGWDGRDRMRLINTQQCPVYMLTGQYDYSCTPAASLITANRISGAIFEEMPNLGHFPATENPKIFIPYLLKAINHICRNIPK